MSGLVDLDGEGGGAPATVGGARIVFVLTAYLSVPEIEVRPSIDEVQGEEKEKDGFNKWGELSLVDITSLPSLLVAAVLVQAAKIIVSVSKGVAQWRKGLKTNGGAKKSKKNNGAGVVEEEQVRANCDLTDIISARFISTVRRCGSCRIT